MRVDHHGRNRDTDDCLQLQENVMSKANYASPSQPRPC